MRAIAVRQALDTGAALVSLRRAGLDVHDDAAARIALAARVDLVDAALPDARAARGIRSRERAVRSARVDARDRQDAGRRENREDPEEWSRGPGRHVRILARRWFRATPQAVPLPRGPRLSFAVALALAGLGCSETSQEPTTDVAKTTPLEHVDVPSCPIGAMPRAGAPTCAPVGPQKPPEGFEAVSGAWGFRAIVPTVQCLPDQRVAIGNGKCVVVDDCSAPFPPPGAKVVVKSGDDLSAAIAKAAPGDTIAIDEGTYSGVRVARDVNLVGRCASKVVLQAASADDRGIEVDGARKIAIRSVTFRGFDWAIWAATSGAAVSVERSIFQGNRAAVWVTRGARIDLQQSIVDARRDLLDPSPIAMADGVVVANGASANVAETELRDIHLAIDAYGPGTRVKATAIVASERSPEMSALVVAAQGAVVEVDRSRLEAAEKYVGGAKGEDDREPKTKAPAKLRITRSELIRVFPTDASGFDVHGASSLELEDCTLASRARVAISSNDSSQVSVVRSVIRPIDPRDAKKREVGAGIVVNDDVALTLEDSAILGMAQSAIMASKGCRITMARSLVAATWEHERKSFDERFESGQAISLSGTASLELTDSTLADNAGAAIWMGGEEARARIERSAVLTTQPEASTAFAGLVAWGGTIEVRDSLFHGVPDTAMALGQVTGLVADTVLSKSAVGFRWLGDSRLVPDADETRRPQVGEILSRNVVQIETDAAELEEPLPLGDCRCAR